LDLTMRTGRLLPAAGLVLGLTLQILAGHPQQVYMTVVALGVLVLWRGLLAPARSAPGDGPAPSGSSRLLTSSPSPLEGEESGKRLVSPSPAHRAVGTSAQPMLAPHSGQGPHGREAP